MSSKVLPLILCVEDDPDTQDMLRIVLQDRGYQFKAVDNCAQALEAIHQDAPTMVLMDNWLPDGSGIELCQQVRKFDKSLPIVFLSGADYENDRDEALSAGANAFIAKPCVLDDLFAVLDEYVPCAQDRC